MVASRNELSLTSKTRLSAFNKHIGQRLRLRRELAELSRPALAKRVGISGFQVGKYEDGRDTISAARLACLAHALDCTTQWFLDGFSDISLSSPSADAEPIPLSDGLSSLEPDFSRLTIDDQKFVVSLIKRLLQHAGSYRRCA